MFYCLCAHVLDLYYCSNLSLYHNITRSAAGDLADQVAAEVEARGFASETRIGVAACARCHPDVTEQWAASAHRFASMNNPFYEATINLLREESPEANRAVEVHLAAFDLPAEAIGRVKSKWCSGCHDPALMLAGSMDDVIDRTTVEAMVEDPRIEALREDRAFWTYVEHGAVDSALNQPSFLRLASDEDFRMRLANLGLVGPEAAEDRMAFRDSVAETLREVGPRVQRLRDDPDMQALMQDPEVVAMVQSGDTLALVMHPRVRRIVSRVASEEK